MDSKIVIGKTGRIVNGDDVGSFVKIQNDSENTGGYLILQSESADFYTGSDDWVENEEALEQYFEESGWDVCWF